MIQYTHTGGVIMFVSENIKYIGVNDHDIDLFEGQLDANLIYVDATDRFLSKLEVFFFTSTSFKYCIS